MQILCELSENMRGTHCSHVTKRRALSAQGSHTNSAEFHRGGAQILHLNLVSAQTPLLMETLDVKVPPHLL